MDFINKYFIEYENALCGTLKNAGFSDVDGKYFLRETSADMSRLIRNMNLETVIKILLSDNPAKLISYIDNISLAIKMEMEIEKVTDGLLAITPVIKQVFLHKNNEIVAMTASLAWESQDVSLKKANDRRS